MFSENQKRRYLDSDSFRYDEGTKEVTERIFETVAETERQKSMDLSEFIHPQVIDLLKNINSRSKYYLRLVSKVCFEYTNWCKIEGYTDRSNINYYDYNSFTKDIIDDLVPLSLVEDKYFTKKYVEDLIVQIDDPVNKLLVYAPFIGINGLNCDNLKHLKYSDIDINAKKVKLYDGKRINIDDLFIELAHEADIVKEYIPDTSNNRKSRVFTYNQSCYIFKPTGKGDIVDQIVSHSYITFRYKVIQQLANNKFINASNLYKNGLINYIKLKFSENNVSLRQAFFEMQNNQSYLYTNELKDYIREFGSSINERQLRLEMKELIEIYE